MFNNKTLDFIGYTNMIYNQTIDKYLSIVTFKNIRCVYHLQVRLLQIYNHKILSPIWFTIYLYLQYRQNKKTFKRRISLVVKNFSSVNSSITSHCLICVNIAQICVSKLSCKNAFYKLNDLKAVHLQTRGTLVHMFPAVVLKLIFFAL